jgi:hypothetical protein
MFQVIFIYMQREVTRQSKTKNGNLQYKHKLQQIFHFFFMRRMSACVSSFLYGKQSTTVKGH